MRIILQNESRKERRLYVPNVLLMNRLTTLWVSHGMEKHVIHLPNRQIQTLMKIVRQIRLRHPEWILLEAEDPKGGMIKIIL